MYKIIIEKEGVAIVHHVTSDAQKLVDIMANLMMDNVALSANKPIFTPERAEKPEKAAKKGKGRGYGVRHCKNCGKVGHRSDNCPEEAGGADKEDDEADLDDTGAISRENFSMVKQLRKEGQTSKSIADDLDLPIEEINYVFSAITYEGYLKLRS